MVDGLMHKRAVARVKGTQAQESLLCIRRSGMAVRSARPVSGRLSSELPTLSLFGSFRRIQRVVRRTDEGGQCRFLTVMGTLPHMTCRPTHGSEFGGNEPSEPLVGRSN